MGDVPIFRVTTNIVVRVVMPVSGNKSVYKGNVPVLPI